MSHTNLIKFYLFKGRNEDKKSDAKQNLVNANEEIHNTYLYYDFVEVAYCFTEIIFPGFRSTYVK